LHLTTLVVVDRTQVKAGDTVTVHATGVVKETDKKFWSTKDPGQQPFTYQAGVGGVITGWDQVILGANQPVICRRPLPNPHTDTIDNSRTDHPSTWAFPDPQGCLGMQVGEVRLLEIPAHEGYGANGFPAWGIPPGGTLFFTLECLKIE